MLTTSAGVDVKNVNVSSVSTALTNIDSLLGKAVNNLSTIKTPSKGLLPLVSGLFGGDNQAKIEVTATLTTIIKQLQTAISGTKQEIRQTPQIVC